MQIPMNVFLAYEAITGASTKFFKFSD